MLSLQHIVASHYYLFRHSKIRYQRCLVGVIAALFLSACSSGSNLDPLTDAGVTTDTPDDADVEVSQPADVNPVFEDQAYAVVTVIPSTQLTVAYQVAELQNDVSADYVSRQWESMSSCLNVAVSSPQVVIVPDWLERAPADDVLFSITGRRIASYAFVDDALDTLTVSAFDFDGSQGVAGFHLRSIIGRYLWSLSGQPARDYDTTCAS